MKALPVLVTLLASALLATPAQAKEWKVIRIGLEAAYKPFTYKTPDGKLTGFDVEIANALCKQMQAECSFVEQDWDGIIPALNARKFDAIVSSMDITEERKVAVDFTNKYYKVPSRLVGSSAANLAGTPESMKGKRIGVLRASSEERYANAVYGKAGATVEAYGSQNDAFLDLKSGRLDASFVNSVVGLTDFLKTPAGQGFRFIGPAVLDETYFGPGAGIAVRKADSDLRDKFNVAIKAIRGNGAYQQIQGRYFDFDIYGK